MMVRRIAIKETYQDGQTILKEGSHGEGTYVILSGKVRIAKKIDNEVITIAELSENEYFGEMSFLDRQPRSASAVAVGEVKLGLLDKDYLEEEINKTSEDFRAILIALTNRLRHTTSQLVNLIVENHKLKQKK
jgi:CRP-like cAMP-binding protein